MTQAGTNEGGRPSRRVLVVDDQQGMRWLLTRILGDAGFEVAVAGTCSAASEQYAQRRYDIVIIDYRLPDGDGLTLFRSLHHRDPGCRAILMTSYGSAELRQTAIHAGMVAYLDKPFSNEHLISLLRDTVGVDEPGVDASALKDLPPEPAPDRPRDANLPSDALGLGVRGGDSATDDESLETLSQRERLQALGEITAGVAHELGNELTMISAAAEQLYQYIQRSGEGRPSVAGRRAPVKARGKVIDRMSVNDGLALSNLILDGTRKMDKMLSGLRSQVLHRKVERHEVDLREVLQQLFVLVKPEFQRRHVALVVEIGEAPAVGLWDTDGLRQIFVNLLINAIEAVGAMPDATVTVRSRVDQAERNVTVEVVNNGLPFSDPKLLFRPFVTTKPEGTGLGLYLSRRMAQSEGGTVTARNLESGGVSFAVRLPLGSGEAGAAPTRGAP